MELEPEAGGTINTGNVKKNIPIKLKTQPKTARGRPRKAAKPKKEPTTPELQPPGTAPMTCVFIHLPTEWWLIL